MATYGEGRGRVLRLRRHDDHLGAVFVVLEPLNLPIAGQEWFTAGTSKKLRPSRPNFKRAWQNAAWNCIRQKPLGRPQSAAATGSNVAQTGEPGLRDVAVNRSCLRHSGVLYGDDHLPALQR